MRHATLVFLLSVGALAQTAGKVTRAVGPASIERSTKTIAAAPDVPVNWNDILKTDEAGRERVVLGDGSILMLTSSARMRVLNHDEKSGKTQLELKYGYVRATVVG